MAPVAACQPPARTVWSGLYKPRAISQTKTVTSEEILSDARWFPLRYDRQSERLQFCFIPFETHRAITFLSDLRPAPSDLVEVPLDDLVDAKLDRGPLHFIQHSGMNGSTLLARVLSQWGVVNTLKEPPILRDLVALRGSDQAETVTRVAGALMARPLTPGMATVVKLNNVGNSIVGELASLSDESRILCMHAPLAVMLASLANRGAEGRSGSRRLFEVLRQAGACDFEGFTDTTAEAMSDLQLGALAWLAMQRQIWHGAHRFGEKRVRSINSETLIARPADSLPAIADHFGFVLDVEQRVAAGVFDRHSKTGEPFNAAVRQRALAERMQQHGDEIQPIVERTQEIAKAHNIPWGLPYPLLV